MFGLGWMEIVVILAVVLLIFGPKRLPEIGRGVGQGINEFKKAGQELTDAMKDEAAKLEDKTDKKDDQS